MDASDCPLTVRELRIVELLAQGLTYKQIGLRLDRSPSTIRSLCHRAYTKLGVADRTQAVLACERAGWIDSPGIDPTARLTLRLCRATEEMCRLIRSRAQLTDPQREYVSAFDQLVYARADEDHIAARRAMAGALAVVLHDADIPDRPRRRRDLVDLLADYIT